MGYLPKKTLTEASKRRVLRVVEAFEEGGERCPFYQGLKIGFTRIKDHELEFQQSGLRIVRERWGKKHEVRHEVRG